MINIVDLGVFKERKQMHKTLILLIHIPINIVLNLLLVPKFGYYGAAIATLITYSLLIFSVTYSSNKLFNVKYEIMNLLIISIVSSITIYISTKIIDQSQFFSINKFLIITLLLFFLLVLF